MNKVRMWFSAAMLCAGALLSTPAATQTLLGVYEGNQGWKMDRVRAMESWQGRRHAVVNLYTDWCPQSRTLDNLFNRQLPYVWHNGNVPMITWEPYLCSPSKTPDDVEVRAAAGMYSSYVAEWARRMKRFLSGPDGLYGSADDRRAYLRLAHEMNGNWYPWGAARGGNAPADYIAMWQHVHASFTMQGIDPTRLQWVWSVNHEDVGGFAAEQYYPGDTYVDWVAVDGYNWGSSQPWSGWAPPAQIFDGIIARLRALTPAKPLALTEVASTSANAGSPDVPAKSGWITELFSYLRTSTVKMVMWFNEDKETDWAAFGGSKGDSRYRYGRTTYQAYSSYRSAVGSAPWLVSPDASNPRLLSDAQFSGTP